jgi:hypothetical protein
MPPIYRSTNGPNDWKEFLAKPDLHWKTGFSARSMAYAWEESGGMPVEISVSLQAAFGSVPEPLFVIPEYKVPLPGGGTESQNDAFLFARIGKQTAAIMIEGKVNEPFGPTVGEWFEAPSIGKKERLLYLCELLGIVSPPPANLRYQLLHRAASAIIEAERFKSDVAIMIVHSFSQEHRWLGDFDAFARHVDAEASLGELALARAAPGRPFYLGWVTGNAEYLER